MSSMLRPVLLALSLGTAAGALRPADAAFVTYTETVTASGTLGTIAFTNAAVTIAQTADTSNVVFDATAGIDRVADATATVSIAGAGLPSPLGATITDATETFITQFPGGTEAISGIALSTATRPIVLAEFGYGPPFTTYDLRSSFGPYAGGVDQASVAMMTDAGALVLTATSFRNPTFQAVVGAAVPEPSSLALCGVAGAVGLALSRPWRARCAV